MKCVHGELEAGSPKVSPRFYPAPIKFVAKWYGLEDLTDIRKLFYLSKQINLFYYTSLKTLPFGHNWLARNFKNGSGLKILLPSIKNYPLVKVLKLVRNRLARSHKSKK